MATKEQTIPKGYKHTEVGVIPSDWAEKYLGSLCGKITTGKLNANAMVEGGEYRFYTCAEEYYQIDKYAFDTEALLISGNGANVGYVHYYKGKFNAYQRTYVLSDFNADVQYLKLFLDRNLKERIRVEVNAGNTPYITMGTLTEMKLAIPESKTEQTAIATALSDTDALIEKLTKLIEKKKNIKQGAMQELLTGKHRLPGFSGKWETKKLGEVTNFDHGRDLPKSDLSDQGKYKCIHYGQLFNDYRELISNIKSKTDKSTNKFYSKSNDVLMPTSDVTPRGLATASCIKEDGIILGGGILVVRLYPEYDGVFLSYYITQHKNDVLRFVKGSTVFHLYAGDISNFEITFPEFKEQTAIATVLSDMDTEIERLESQLAKYQSLKQGMMQTLLTGKIRLI